MAYQELSTSKYWRASALSEVKQIKQAQASQSIRSFNLFMVAYLVIMGCMYLMNHPDMLAQVYTVVEQTGVPAKIQSLIAQ